MLPIDEQLSILVHLSMADKFMADEELGLINTIGKRNGLTQSQIETIIDNPKPIPKLKNLPSDEKFEYLYNVIQLMKVDGKIFQSEIRFCEKLAMALGYRPGVVSELSAFIYSDPSITTSSDHLKKIANEYAIK